MKKYIHYTIAIISILFLIRCEKDENPELLKTVFTNKIPEITTAVLSEITDTSAVSGGVIINAGGAKITANGVCWSITPNPTINNNKTIDYIGKLSFNSKLLGLNPFTTYYLRAYAINSIGVAYGNALTFKTSTILAKITTKDITNVTDSSVICGGDISSDGGAEINSRGVCWSTSQNPTINNSKTSDGKGLGSFTSNITGLTAGTIYYTRAYATNSTGIAYGNEISFTTTQYIYPVYDIDGNGYDTVHIGAQVWMKQNLKTTNYKNGAVITYTGISNSAWQNNSNGAYTWYNNDSATYKNIYGALYNWHAVNTGNLCPAGWHVPTDAEWSTLTTYLGGESIAGGKLKATILWNSPNTGASNSSGFTALPGGYRSNYGDYFNIGDYSYWWSTTSNNSASAYGWRVCYDFSDAIRNNGSKANGFSIRCLKNSN